MTPPREPVLPDGMKDLIEQIWEDDAAKKKRVYESMQHMRLARVALKGKWISSFDLFQILAERIDHDLLFADDFELVRPKIREVTDEEWGKVFSHLPLFISADVRILIVESAVRGVWELICHSRPIYVGDRRSYLRILELAYFKSIVQDEG